MTFAHLGNTISGSNGKGQKVASLEVQGGKKSFQLHRAGKNIASASHHRITGTTDLTIHGQSVKMRQSWEGMRDGKDISSPWGEFVWRTGGSTFRATEDLIEKRTGARVASCRIPSLGKGNRQLEVLLPREDVVVDLAVASWLILLG